MLVTLHVIDCWMLVVPTVTSLVFGLKTLALTTLVCLIVCKSAFAATFQIADPIEFAKIIDTNTAVLTTNAQLNTWLEGPVWIPSDGGYLVFCDQGNNRLRKLTPPNTLTNYLLPPANTLYNGTMLDAHERLLGAQAGGAGLRIVMLTNGVVTTLVSNYNGMRFYSPNDVIVKNDGSIWFTDPGYNGGIGPPPQSGFAPGYWVYRFFPTNGQATCTPVITNGIVRPNGLCFSPDETKLYVADSDNSRRRILVYNVTSSNTLSGGTVFANIANGIPDGIRSDVDGRIWSSAGDGVHIFAPDGHLIGKILFHRTANLCFGGPQYKTLYMTGQPLVTSVPVLVRGIPSVKKLEHVFEDNTLKITWPAPSTGFQLEHTTELNPSSTWTNIAPTTTNNQNQITIIPTNDVGFYRLNLP
jgi:gluconolactonase